MTQFEGLEFRPVTLPFVSSVDKAQEAVGRINRAAEEQGLRPIVFSTLVQDDLREIVVTANALFLDLFSTFVGPLERELDTRSTHRAGRAHGMADLAAYTTRINATNFALANDDGSGGDYAHADVVLVGVSRVGKTPTCLYLALQYGATAADPQRAPPRQSLRLPAAGAVRAAHRGGAVRALRAAVARYHRVLHRGDRQPDSEHQRHRAAPAPVALAPRSWILLHDSRRACQVARKLQALPGHRQRQIRGAIGLQRKPCAL